MVEETRRSFWHESRFWSFLATRLTYETRKKKREIFIFYFSMETCHFISSGEIHLLTPTIFCWHQDSVRYVREHTTTCDMTRRKEKNMKSRKNKKVGGSLSIITHNGPPLITLSWHDCNDKQHGDGSLFLSVFLLSRFPPFLHTHIRVQEYIIFFARICGMN